MISSYTNVAGVGGAVVTYNLKNTIVDIESKDKKIEYDSMPVYYMDEEKALFPNEMTIVFPMRDASQYRLYKYSTYYKEDSLHFIKNNTDIGTYDYFFLYDGKNVFFFPDETTLKINDKEYILTISYDYSCDTHREYGEEWYDLTYSINSFELCELEEDLCVSNELLGVTYKTHGNLFKEYTEKVDGGIYDPYLAYGVSEKDFF